MRDSTWQSSTRGTREKGFEEWGEVFGDDVMAAALIDRLVHHCHVVTIRGNSYRMRQHSELWQTLHTGSSGEYDELRLVLSPICQILDRRNCQIFNRR